MALLHRLLTLLLSVITLAAAATTEQWKSRSIYFALTDRVARSSSDTGGGSCGNLGSYCGGTFKGLEAKLDYILGMGFDAIWITPVVANSAGGYHGYWAADLYSVNSNYGTADDLKSLVSAAHAKNMYVMVDVVVNHMGTGAIQDNKPAPLNDPNSYHPQCNIDYSNQASVENCRIANLPDINTQKTEIRSMFQQWIKWLVTEYSFDGIRIDTVKHVEKDFFPDFVAAAGVYAIGEVFNGDPAYLAGYSSVMPGLLDYATYYPLNRFYQQVGTAQELKTMLDTVGSTFPDPSALGTFLDNHDNPRWLSQKNDISLFKNALAFVTLSRGIPIVYYGTEQAFSGGADPANREDLWRTGFNTQSELYQTLSRLLGAKKSAGGLADNDVVHLYVTNNAYAWSRAGGKLIVVTTNTGTGTTGNYCFNAQQSNTQWTNVFSNEAVMSDQDGNICVGVSNGEPVVLLSAGAAAETPTSTSKAMSRSSSSSSVVACPTAVTLTFNHKVTTVYGDTVKVVGNVTQLGSWAVAKGTALSASRYTASNPLWSGQVKLPAGIGLEYKFVRVTSGGAVAWESGANRVYKVPACQAGVTLDGSWK